MISMNPVFRDIDPANYNNYGMRVDEKEERCSCCGTEIAYDTQMYADFFGEILGCKNCIDKKYSEDYFLEDEETECPCCGQNLVYDSDVYINSDNEIVGCCFCVNDKDWGEFDQDEEYFEYMYHD